MIGGITANSVIRVTENHVKLIGPADQKSKLTDVVKVSNTKDE